MMRFRASRRGRESARNAPRETLGVGVDAKRVRVKSCARAFVDIARRDATVGGRLE